MWDRAAIDDASRILDNALQFRSPGPFQLQAALAALHATSPTAAETDWEEIVLLYDRLSEIAPTPVVALNRAVAIAMASGPASGLALVEEIERGGDLADYYLLPATRADLLRRLGHFAQARAAYERALELAPTDAERRYLTRRLAEVTQNAM